MDKQVIIDSLKSLVNVNKVCIDNTVFRLHYRFTFLILIACSVLVTSNQYIGDPIKCISDATISNIMDTFCWIHSTYTIGKRDPVTKKVAYQDAGEEDLLDIEVSAHPGIHTLRKHDKLDYQTYYQWVWIILLFQAMLFYLPHSLWKICDGGKIKSLASDMINTHVLAEDKKSEKKKIITDYFAKHKGRHTVYGIQFFLCEVLNFLNVIIQIFVTDAYLGNEFTQYGLEVLSLTQRKPYFRSDPMARVFPTVTACEINRFGPSGKIVPHDALCILPINILNEKIYIILWFWFVFIATVSALTIIFRIAVNLIPSFRKYQIERRAGPVDSNTLKRLSRHYGMGDWFLLVQLGRNMDPSIFGELLELLGSELVPRIDESKKKLLDP